MNVLIVGAGLSGCTIARRLKDEGHDVSMIEKEPHLGGLCITRVNKDGLNFEPFGARTFHTNSEAVRDFILRFDEFNGYTHRKGMIINGQLFPFPITRRAIGNLPEHQQIFQELADRPQEVDQTNFETAAISIFGRILYQYFIENYTRKMWGRDPRELTADWAPKRLELGEDDNDELFRHQWQGLPRRGYSFLLERMAQDIPVRFNTTQFDAAKYDLVMSSAPIDQIMGYKFGRLQYRSLAFSYRSDEPWERADYGTINLPQHQTYIRKCNFNVLHRVDSKPNWIQYQRPIEADDQNVPMYPVHTMRNTTIFDSYLREIAATNICPIGRLGLFKYLDMDRAVLDGLEVVPLASNYPLLSRDERYARLRELVRTH